MASACEHRRTTRLSPPETQTCSHGREPLERTCKSSHRCSPFRRSTDCVESSVVADRLSVAANTRLVPAKGSADRAALIPFPRGHQQSSAQHEREVHLVEQHQMGMLPVGRSPQHEFERRGYRPTARPSGAGFRPSSYPNNASAPVQSGRTAATCRCRSPSHSPNRTAICVFPDPDNPVKITKGFAIRLERNADTRTSCRSPN